jgi:hypothetical protein
VDELGRQDGQADRLASALVKIARVVFGSERRRTFLVVALAIVALGVQLIDLPLGPRSETASPPLIDVPAPDISTDPTVIWRTYGPDGAAPTATWMCGAALQRGTGHAALIVRACAAQPLTPERRYGLGYDGLTIEADLPGGGHLAYSLLDRRPSGPFGWTQGEGPTSANTVAVRMVYVRESTDIVIQLESDLPSGLPTVSVRGSLNGTAFSETRAFEPLGPSADARQLELRHAADAPRWARLLP